MGYTVGAWAFVIGAEGEAGRPVGVVLEELLARVGAVLRRSGRLTSRVTTVGDLVMDEEATLATRGPTRRPHRADRERIFERCVRLEPSRSRDSGGPSAIEALHLQA